MIEFILRTCLYFITSYALYSAIRNFISKKYLWFSMFFHSLDHVYVVVGKAYDLIFLKGEEV